MRAAWSSTTGRTDSPGVTRWASTSSREPSTARCWPTTTSWRRLRGPLFVGAERPTPASGSGANGGSGETPAGADGEAAPSGDAGSDRQTEIGSMGELVDHFISAGKRGVAINRYKGLGEMNPDQLWTTTMNPENRTLLQVRAEDDAEADHMFTTLMGDQVEPRRKFIQDNALDVKNLDI